MKNRLSFLLRFYLLTVLVFVIAKLVFMACNHAAAGFSAADVVAVVAHGLTLDLSTALYFLLIPLLAVIASLWVRVPRWLLKPYYALAAIILSLAFVADTSLYEFWHFKLDASCLQYLDTPTEAMASVSTGYLIVRLLAMILIAAGIYAAFSWKTAHFLPESTIVSRSVRTAFYLFLIPLMVIGVRGGLSESTTNIGQVYFSQNQFLNHAAVNPVFSFMASFEKTASNNTVYRFMDDERCRQIMEKLYNTESIGSDTLLTTQTPNIMIILMEGCGGTFTEIGGRTDITPNLNRLAHEGIYFTHCYGNTWRTDRGTVCALSGYPSFPTMSVMKIPSKSRTLPTIAKTLQQQRGYNTSFLYGGDINFTNMRSYIVAGGFQQFTWKKDYTKEEQASSQWGVRDDITFNTLYDMATAAQEPFFITFLTLSSHLPWDVPIHHFDDEELNAFYYLDQCVGQFVERFRQSSAWDNTLLIILPDHGIPYLDIGEGHPLTNHIPMIWLGGAVKQARHIDQVCNQTDLPATLFGQLGIAHDDYTFSRDVLSSTYTQPFAIHTYDDGYAMYDSTSYVCFDFIGNRVINEKGNPAPVLHEWAKAILQAASNDLDKR